MRFSCNGCGKCCHDHHVPLTLAEARDWASDGGALIILLEAVLADGSGLPAGQREHVLRRSLAVRCGQTRAHLAITFAAFNQGACRHLGSDMRCAIYQRRPLVCRIYPMEINPHIPLRAENKDCPAQVWETGPELIVGGQLVDAQLAELIERSRQADREEIAAKAAICQRLGISTSALKGDGFTSYLPQREAFLDALNEVQAQSPEQSEADWALHVSNAALARQLEETGAMIAAILADNCSFIALRADAA
ncbi:YkgJ family cysteine cluster protein [Pseudomonas panipatensis]|uniref:Fe-S-cluster containining protein n=1 Tax=Pseudomonas panipatensis TaxID=428992 RepID=A0A1G8DQ56_9PSED|nr:YkgJ family cysteine cluster protein [Pseudomonas panipatensis]SDH59589.1 Fe-S-cluster containining protein [Pseudomonas panipatensis]SMP40370.1 Fe-S-cluster containining protein [Pseudomonas panipatensis]